MASLHVGQHVACLEVREQMDEAQLGARALDLGGGRAYAALVSAV